MPDSPTPTPPTVGLSPLGFVDTLTTFAFPPSFMSPLSPANRPGALSRSPDHRMATGKQKKRLMNSTNSEQCRPWEKTKFDSSNCLLSLNPHIGLKWDQYLRRVVPKKEQVGILWSGLAPFIDSKKHRSGLADVTYVPSETFALASLSGVLSYEVWSTCLTEAERKFLIQFLPGETGEEENVHLLLTGKNHHFGNPFLSWSSSLCHGDIHPDAVLNKEKHMKKDEKAYHINLLNYNSKMVDTLKKWRNTWLSCGDTENLFRDYPANQKLGPRQLKTTKSGIPLLKIEQSVDVSKFMSYIMVSGTQLKHIKRLKQSGDGIQINHVSRVIGGLDKSHVKPYGTLLEDGQRRLRAHWVNMSCNDVPAAFEVLKDRKVLMEESRKLLGLQLVEKNVYVSRKANQLTETMKELGQSGASENDGSPILQNDQVDHSPQSMLQGGDDHSASFQDPDDEQTKDMDTSVYHIDCLNVKDHDLMVARGTDITNQTEQNSDVQDQDHNGVCCISYCANNADEQNEDLTGIKLHKDALGVKDEVIKEISYEDPTRNNYNAESQQISSIKYTSTHINTVESKNKQVENLGGVSYKGPPVHAHEQDQDRQSINHAIVNHSCGHSVNISSEMSHPKTSTVIVVQEVSGSIMMVPSNSSSLLPKSSGEQMHQEDFLGVKDQVAKGEIERWQLASPLQPHYHHPQERITYDVSGHLHIRQQYVSSGQQSSSIYLASGILSQQQAQLATSVFPVDYPASVIEPLSNPPSNGQVHTAKDIGAVTNSIEQSTGLNSLANNHLAQSVPFPRSLQEQKLIDPSDNGLYALLQEDKDQDRNGASCVDKGSSCCANNPDDWNADLTDIELCKDGLGVKDEGIQEISNEATTINNYRSESQEIKSINYTSPHINTLECENMQLKDLDEISYKGPSVHAHEQDQDLESISYAIVNHSGGHSVNISSEMSNTKMNTEIVDQKETDNIMMMPSNSSTLLPKSSGEQMYLEDFLDINDQVAKGEEDRWQLVDPLQSHYHPPENEMYNGSGFLQITQPFLSSGQQSSSVCLDNGILSPQQAQLAASVFPVGNPASVSEPFSNRQRNHQLQVAKDIGAVSDPLEHAKSIEQLIDESEDGLCTQLHENYYADGCESHNSNLSGLESGNCLTQALPIGSSSDATLLSAISHYKQPLAPMEHEARNQVGPPQNLLPGTQDTSPSVPDMYGCTKNMASSGSSHEAPVGSVDNMQWTNFIQQNSGMLPDFTKRPLGGPWTR